MEKDSNALAKLVAKTNSFATQLQDGLYQGSGFKMEFMKFRKMVSMLSAKREQFIDKRRRYGFSGDHYLLHAIQNADEILDKKPGGQNSNDAAHPYPSLRLITMQNAYLFFFELNRSLNYVVEMVDAAARLPFGPDGTYVPISGSILDVQKALEDPDGPCVIIVRGDPGMGKSCLVKYLALHYEYARGESLQYRAFSFSFSIKNSTIDKSLPNLFPNGVFYLCCERKGKGRVKWLLMELLTILGFGPGSAAQLNDSSNSGPAGQTSELADAGSRAQSNDLGCAEMRGEYFDISSYQTKLTSRLAQQKLLIVLDDLRDAKILQYLLVFAKGVKYLVTSQIRGIWSAAKEIELQKPSKTEALRIMTNYMDLILTESEFSTSMETLMNDIIEQVEYHPLLLAKVCMIINRARPTEASQFEAIRDYVKVLLDEFAYQISPVCFGIPYNLADKERLRRGQQRNEDSSAFSWYHDPLTWEKMCDPVVCSDGRTYDRWTIIDQRISTSPYDRNQKLVISTDNLDVRSRLFGEFPEQQQKFRERRSKYREEALQHAQADPVEFEEAIEKLNNVLKWLPRDPDCQNELDRVVGHASHQHESPSASMHEDSTYEIPRLMHEDVIRARMDGGGGRLVIFLVFLYIAVMSFVN